MTNSERSPVSRRQVVRTALMSLMMALAFSAACRAGGAVDASDATAATVPAAPAPDAASPRVSHHRPIGHLTVAQSLDENVRRLTRGLDLDPVQQEKLRQILVDQHRQVMQLRSGESAAPTDVTGATLAIYAQTKGRIRAMLSDEQKSRYSADLPRDTLAPAQADLAHWMQMQESSRKQRDGASQ